jgi:hypothetical protein
VKNPNLHFCSKGLLELRGNTLTLHRPGQAEPAWESKLPAVTSWHGFLLADEERLLALPAADSTQLAVFVRMADGKVLGEARRPPTGNGYLVPVGLARDGKRLAAHLDDRLLLFEVPSGKLLKTHPVKERNYFHFLGGLRDGWLISGSYYTRLFDEEKGWVREVPQFQYVTGADDLDTPAGRRLLLSNSYGRACLVDPGTGKVIHRWVEGGRSGRAPQEGSAVAAGGRLLLRPLAWQGAAELVSLKDLKTVLTVYPVPIGKEIGWVACTPDGLWDASAGAEGFVAVFGPQGPADARARDARRDPAAIRARVREAWGPASK